MNTATSPASPSFPAPLPPIPYTPPPQRSFAALADLYALLRQHRPRMQDAVKLRAARSFLERHPILPRPPAIPPWLESLLSLADTTQARLVSRATPTAPTTPTPM